jgi:hypothetical protein
MSPAQDIKGAPELRTRYAAIQENSKFSGSHAPATKVLKACAEAVLKPGHR